MDSKPLKKSKMGHRWVICGLLFFSSTTLVLDRQLLSILAEHMMYIFDWSTVQYGWIANSFVFFYGIFMLVAGRFIDLVGTKRGLFWSFVVWNIASVLHAFAPEIGRFIGLTMFRWNIVECYAHLASFEQNPVVVVFGITNLAVSTSVIGFVVMRAILGIGEGGNFPAAMKATAEWFPKKERSFCTGLFNSGTNIGAIIAPITIFGVFSLFNYDWRWVFVILGGITLVWLIFWQMYYDSPAKMLAKGKITQEEYDYIHSDNEGDEVVEKQTKENKTSFWKIFTYPQTWAFAIGKFLTDAVWWFFLLFLPLYLFQQFGLVLRDSWLLLMVVYTPAMFGSIYGGYFPKILMERGMTPYKARTLSMLGIALIPLVFLFAQPLSHVNVWIPVIFIGFGLAAHQAWSANLFTSVSDMFPKKAVGTVVGFGGFTGTLGVLLIVHFGSHLIDYHLALEAAGLGSVERAYGILFIFCALAYLLAWAIMKILVPKYKLIKDV